jgi:cbb3-type cytochrome oxidase subunit 3
MEWLRAVVTALVMASFIAIVWWAYAPWRKADWERKGKLSEDA